MEKKKEKRGRKPVADKIVRIDVFVRTSMVKLVGGKEKANYACLQGFQNAVNKKTGEKHFVLPEIITVK